MKILILLSVLILSGCGEIFYTVEDHLAITPDEVKCVKEQVKVMSDNLPKTLSIAGEDQRYDRAIKQISSVATVTCTPTRLFEVWCDYNRVHCAKTGKYTEFNRNSL